MPRARASPPRVWRSREGLAAWPASPCGSFSGGQMVLPEKRPLRQSTRQETTMPDCIFKNEIDDSLVV